MVKVIPWETKCKKCDVRLEYYNEDVIKRNELITTYHDVEEHEWRGYIKCPICGCEIRVY